jgi:hypothetical protein
MKAALLFNNLEGKGVSSLMRARYAIGLSCIFTRPGALETKGWCIELARHDVNGGLLKGSQLWSQATKCMWWMPRRLQAMKDVAACEKLRGAGKRALIRRCPNGETRPARVTPD